ncbi:MAG: MFS transporter [Promethearchaeota archaeon]
MKKRDIFSLILFLSLILIIIMDSYLFLPNQVLVAADLGIYFDTIGVIIGTYIVIQGISIIIFGYLSDKIERKKLIIFAGALWSLAAIMHILISNIVHLYIARIAAAIASGVTGPLAISYLTDIVSSDSRSKLFAGWTLITTFGSLIAGVIALMFNKIPYERIDTESESIRENINYIIANYSSLLNTWRFPFLILGLIGLIFTMLNVFFAQEPKRAAKDKLLEDILSNEDLQYTYRIKFSDLRTIFKRKSNIFLTINFFDVVVSGLLVSYLFPYFELELGISFSDPMGLAATVVLILIIGPLGLVIGQFGLAHLGDKKVQKGDLTGRVKIATICGILNIPFILIGFMMTPSVSNQTFFLSNIQVNLVGFWLLWIIFALFIGIGLGFSLGIAPNWYSSLIDGNLPEHRGTMIAMGLFIDTFGRALGAILGGFVVNLTDSFSLTIIWSTLIFGIISTCFWIPLFYTSKKDYAYVNEIMKERSVTLETIQD